MNVRKTFAFALTLTMACCSGYGTVPCLAENVVSASAVDVVDSGTCGDNLTWTLDSEGTLTISGEGCMPFMNNPLPMESIGDKIKKVVIQNGVEYISPYAFAYCENLTSVTIPDSVGGVDKYTFMGTPWLENKRKENPFIIVNGILIDVDNTACEGDVVIPDSVTSIGYYAFEDCTSLKSITIPNSVTNIESDAFSKCFNLTSITIADSVTQIAPDVFSDTSWLKNKQKENPLVIVNGILIDGKTCEGDVVIPDSVTRIGQCAFSGCSKLTSITIPDSVTTIGGAAFINCTSLESITIPDSVKIISSSDFENTPWFENKQKENPLVIINGVLIDGIACEGDVVVPDSVKSIGESAFYNCSKLTSITIPSSVPSIGVMSFSMCTSLKSITILNPNCEIMEIGVMPTIFNTSDNGKIQYSGVIIGYKGSTAEKYAEKYGYKFESLGEAPTKTYSLGDPTGDTLIDATDASFVLAEYAKISTGGTSALTDAEKTAADANSDGAVDASDASLILAYYAHVSTGGKQAFTDFIKSIDA